MIEMIEEYWELSGERKSKEQSFIKLPVVVGGICVCALENLKNISPNISIFNIQIIPIRHLKKIVCLF